jgi:hypothetical protein
MCAGNASPASRILLSPPVPRRVTTDTNNPPLSADAASGANSFHHRYNQNAPLPNHHFYHQPPHHHHQEQQKQQGYYHSSSLSAAAISHRPPFYSMSPPTLGQEGNRQMSSHLGHPHGIVSANYFPHYLHHPPRPCFYPDAVTFANTRIEAVGDKSFKIYRVRLPPCLLPLLDTMVVHAEAYAATRPDGWRTDLYSLTKQDLALMDIPGMAKLVEPIVYVIKSSMILLYGKHRNGSPATAKNTAVEIDKNQPHILKYSVDTGHTGGTCATVCQAILSCGHSSVRRTKSC